MPRGSFSKEGLAVYRGGGYGQTVRSGSTSSSRQARVMEATPPQEDLSLSTFLLLALFLGHCALGRALKPYFTGGDDGWDLTDSSSSTHVGNSCDGGGNTSASSSPGGGDFCNNDNGNNISMPSRDVAIFTAVRMALDWLCGPSEGGSLDWYVDHAGTAVINWCF
jgi:hypothetical protein